ARGSPAAGNGQASLAHLYLVAVRIGEPGRVSARSGSAHISRGLPDSRQRPAFPTSRTHAATAGLGGEITQLLLTARTAEIMERLCLTLPGAEPPNRSGRRNSQSGKKYCCDQ